MKKSSADTSQQKVSDILIVEDNSILTDILELKLEQEGYSVTKTGNGKEGLKLAREQDHDLLILDIMLPEMNGFEILKKLREENRDKELKVLILTSKGREDDLKLGFELDANEYMTKPFSVEELVMRIKRLIG